MSKQRGFTLIELLVVIAIIVLLMAILMPALGRAKKQAKAVVCQSNLQQWGLIFAQYADDYDGSTIGAKPEPGAEHWIAKLRPYYQNEKLRFCPMATRPWIDQPDWFGDKHLAWIIPGGVSPWRPVTISGSYGINDYCWNVPPGVDQPSYGIFEIKDCWRSFNIKGGNNVPLFSDCIHTGQGVVDEYCEPPRYEDTPFSGGDWTGFGRICINRHGTGQINVLFMDLSTRPVGLKELWTLKWNRSYDIHGPWTKVGGVLPDDWPDWMRKFKDY